MWSGPKLASWEVIWHSRVMRDLLFSQRVTRDFPLKFPWWLMSFEARSRDWLIIDSYDTNFLPSFLDLWFLIQYYYLRALEMWTISLLPRKGSKIYKNWSEHWPEIVDPNIRLRVPLRSGGKGKKRDWSPLEYLMGLRLNGHTTWPPTQTFFGWQRGFPWRVMCDRAQISLVRSDLA